MLHAHVSGRPGIVPHAGCLASGPEAPEEALDQTLEELGTAIAVDRNAEIFAQGEPVTHFYKVVSGVVRTCVYLEDGHRQIGSFQLPGDLFGIGMGDRHAFSAEAVTDCQLVRVRRSALEAASKRRPELCRAMLACTFRSMERLRAHVTLLGRRSALERVVAFLRALSERQHQPSVIELPMSRQDIADHLGLTIETVSRTMTQLQDIGLITLDGSRRVRVRESRLAA
ncbi:CRP/FNR family nitrogen fixation transcriptional regulator [Amorphus suaedae]